MACGYDECGMDCAPGCTGCSGSCGSGCAGGCSGCGSGCSGGCDGCSGCGGACSSSCSGCSGSCSGACDNGCTATNMASFYNSLGVNIKVNSIIKAVDINDIITAVNKELSRRGYSNTVAAVTANNMIAKSTRDNIRTQLVKLGLASSTAQYDYCKASEMQDYITYIKTLYEKNLKG